ncbi:exodeoxyribonuclease VII large subunit [Alteromonas mediterranea MED64]|uniref:Exodeoxyribonuclease VII large subunit n=1 Tax=Alteromonas mediterranea (strain DSM 17117 / CIP 110805 / LMG 28347 / Deep ecotype) TaxID=1774373 RepID=F2G260_ALTMD|nr:exodeoxyribonuclease VII large subunit [Alteromonas mediterranea DE]AGP82547.1 exodeoxyribonuclease VII large subunit [Alteromonas mediterranea MED64]AGP86376.1 exodeoxyribonuclease VII large subunit [Alteromonas mediterranea U4]AGP90515.1 exodeoxyribonuclease VII large subunit [Alteromonas mediterranea U7]AGP94335.1 exodeoxyribonuclease VII large subunit [Alteromonas mediterranea U8]CAH1198975.1 hypothetical protein ISS312_03075 [Alteromonas mediterranea]
MSVVKSYNHTSSLQKNQVYNWYDRYKPKQQLKTYVLSDNVKPKATPKTSFIKRLSAK